MGLELPLYVEVVVMRWGWARVDASNWRFSAEWAISCDWATGRWYVVRDGKWLLEDYPDTATAISAAEAMMQ